MRRRWVKRMIVFGLVGVTATVLSSWSIPLVYGLTFPRLSPRARPYAPHPRLELTVVDWPYSGHVSDTYSFGVHYLQTPLSVTLEGEPANHIGGFQFASLKRSDYGWPMRGMRTYRLIPTTSPPTWGPRSDPIPVPDLDPLTIFDRGVTSRPLLPKTNAESFRLPLRPIWPGFAVNAVFYAGVCWLLLAAPGDIRRWRRRRRGACAACGYDLAGLEACPECGAGGSREASPARE